MLTPLPVLFDLFNWQNKQPLFQDWLVAELQSKYGVSPKLGQQWIEERALFPLLDGLDEVAPVHQERCVQQLRAFLVGESAPLSVVVCSSVAASETDEPALPLNGVVELRALSDQQVQAYLTTVKRKDLWQLLSKQCCTVEVLSCPPPTKHGDRCLP